MIRHLIDYKMGYVNNDLIYYISEFEKKIKYYIEDILGSDFFNKLDVIYKNGIFNAYIKENHNLIDLNYYIDNNLVIIPREIIIKMFDEKYIFVDVNSDFPKYKNELLKNYDIENNDLDFNYISKNKKKMK